MQNLRYRFKKDFNLPISVISDIPVFHYQLIEYGLSEDWIDFVNFVKDAGGSNEFYIKYDECKQSIIDYITGSDAYKAFNEGPMDQYKVVEGFKTGSVWNDGNAGRTFLSIDLKSANFQVMKLNGIISDNSWEDMLEKVLPHKEFVDYFSKSKYVRQVVFGQCNPKRTIALEKYYIQQVLDCLTESGLVDKEDLFIKNNDELVFTSVNVFNLKLVDLIKETVKEKTGIEVSVKMFQFRNLVLQNLSRNSKVCAGYLVYDIKDKKYSLKCVPEPYRIMFHEILKTPGLFFYGKGSELDITDSRKKLIEHEKMLCEIKDALRIIS